MNTSISSAPDPAVASGGSPQVALGIDVGGSGIKGAPVNLRTGTLMAPKVRVVTPQPATPEAVMDVIATIIDHFAGSLGKKSETTPIGVTVPGPVTQGVVRMAANIDSSWVDLNADAMLTERLGRDVHLVNDVDAAGVAEAQYGACIGHPGLVVVTALGTGIGSALMWNGELIPNSELGHLEMDGHDAEDLAAASVFEAEQLSWAAWAERLQRYYSMLENLLWPSLFVVGGGVSKDAEHFLPLLRLRTPIVPAGLRNKAGIIGAALLAQAESISRHH
ncbi:MAG: polyphosphate--glucose phosphotransferase [Actinomycetota bacterium]